MNEDAKSIELKSSFSAVVAFTGSNDEEVFDVELNKDVASLTYDEVEAAICDAVDKKHGYSNESFEDEAPYEIASIVVNEGDESYPVLCEDDDTSELMHSKVYDKFLVLPWAIYELTPECKLWMKMKEMHLISEDASFDFDKYHKLVES